MTTIKKYALAWFGLMVLAILNGALLDSLGRETKPVLAIIAGIGQ